MKIKRYKKVSKIINFYVNNFKFREPYQILIDGTFCHTALKNQVNIADNIPRYLQAELKLLTTQCVIIETEELGSKVLGALKILKQYKIHKCGHEGKPIGGADCLISMVGQQNDKHYIIATQDRDLQSKIRNVPGVPLLYLHMKTPVLEAPSEASMQAVENKLSNTTNSQIAVIGDLKQKIGLLNDDVKLKKKKKKGPNPLSCKRKKKLTVTQNPVISKTTIDDCVKKKRKKIRIPQHVKELTKNVKK